MRVGLTLKPGDKGTKKLLTIHGDKLVCVRYRYDDTAMKRIKTVELVVEEIEWKPGREEGIRNTEYRIQNEEREPAEAEEAKSTSPDPDQKVFVKIKWNEKQMQQRAKNAGAWWDTRRELWRMKYRDAVEMGLTSRVVEEKEGKKKHI